MNSKQLAVAFAAGFGVCAAVHEFARGGSCALVFVSVLGQEG